MFNKILLALFVLFLLTLLGWCSPQCSRRIGSGAGVATAPSTEASGTATADGTSGGAAAVQAAPVTAAGASDQAAELAAEAASTTLDISSDPGAAVVETVKETRVVATEMIPEPIAAMPEEPAPRPEDFIADHTTKTAETASASAGAEAVTAGNTADNSPVEAAPPSQADNGITAEAAKISAALSHSGDNGHGSGNVVLEGVNFQTNSDRLTADSIAVLAIVARDLMENQAIMVEIAGYTDNTGDAGYNVDLSQRRANAVVDYLTSRGIDAARLSAKGYGAASPIADNATATGRKQNRRVEMHVR